MQELRAECILSGAKNAQRNAWGGRYFPNFPAVRRVSSTAIEWSTSLVTVEVTPFDEVVLSCVMKFLFTPVWLVHQWYQSGFMMAGAEEMVEQKIDSWVKLGIVWREDAVTGQYLRPTYALFQMFQQPPYRYCDIPFNTLTHTISEQQVYFEVCNGTSPILKKERVMPRVSELGFEGKLNGTNIISEEDFRNPQLYSDGEYKRLMDVEARIDQGVKDGLAVTPELVDFRYFSIVKKVDNRGSVKTDLEFHIPDMCIPVVRDHGKPSSIAIEVELTNKRTAKYIDTMKRYCNNSKYGVVYWLCANSAIATALRDAYREAGGTGSCRTELLEFQIPSPRF